MTKQKQKQNKLVSSNTETDSRASRASSSAKAGCPPTEIQENYSEIISPTILTILHGQDFFTDIQYFSEVLFPIRNAILAVESNHAILADCYINLMKIVAAI
ncbi:12488_t:CDS:2 [Dentiscutata heterogama]|uniref:12488_t:CDS:1 n=1 Tax=Dentiscutata heterogama TaxID=1316150 RepID=A0ACA9NZ16_9GLOM|nr:12488_t:CDS:2 [Dentiscutata heterogama]